MVLAMARYSYFHFSTGIQPSSCEVSLSHEDVYESQILVGLALSLCLPRRACVVQALDTDVIQVQHYRLSTVYQ